MTNQFMFKQHKRHLPIVNLLNFPMVDMVLIESLNRLLEDNNFRTSSELIAYGLKQFNEKYKDNIYGNTPFALYEKYTYEQVCQLLEWPQNEVPLNIGVINSIKKQRHIPFY